MGQLFLGETLTMGNPASAFCVQRGGRVEIVTYSDGAQGGDCILPDGTRCDEWKFYRGECPAVRGDVGGSAVPWVAGGLLLTLAIGVYALEKKGPAPVRYRRA